MASPSDFVQLQSNKSENNAGTNVQKESMSFRIGKQQTVSWSDASCMVYLDFMASADKK